MKKNTEFLVSETAAVEDGFVVYGITNVGVVAIGDRFSKLQRKSAKAETLYFDIDLQVRSIAAYRRQIDELPEGMGGELMLTGICTTTFEANDMLC